MANTPYGTGNITDANIADIIAAANSHSISAGGFSVPGTNKTEIEEYAIKLDWNINENHRAALRYSRLEQSVLRFPEIDNNSVSLSSFWYALPKTFESYVGELFSDWSENFSTEFKIGYKEYSAIRSTFSNLPQIEVRGFGSNGQSSVFLGTEINSHVNVIETKEWTGFGAANWYIGDHTVKFGADYSANDILNFYGRAVNGVYTFNNLAQFQAGTPSNYTIRAPRPGGSMADIPAQYTLKNVGLFAQDTWAVNYNLTLNFGLRVDIPDFSDQRLYNPLIEQTYGYDNTQTVDDKLVQPRFGFNYTFDSDGPTQLRGGVGLFGGAAPNVWLAGTYQNTGLNYVEYSCSGAQAPVFSPSPAPNIPANCLAGNARANVDIVEPGLKLPSVWKTNIALDHELPWHGIVASAELLLTKVNDGIVVDRLDMYNAAGQGPTAYGQDGRPIFWNAAGLNPANANPTRGIVYGTGGVNPKN